MTGEILTDLVEEIARKLPSGHAAALAAALEQHEQPTAEARAHVVAAVATPAFADLAGRLLQAWADAGRLSGPALAVAIRGAAKAVERERQEQSLEIVWTGPKTTVVPVRLTREVLIDVIRAAREALIVVSFAAYKVDVVLRELAAAADRGVVIRLILETGEASGGTLTFDAAHAFESLRERAAFYVWPTDRRPVLERGRAALHAKAAIADDHTALVTSANLTGHAITENMELGLLVRGGPIPGRLRDHFRELIAQKVLVEILR